MLKQYAEFARVKLNAIFGPTMRKLQFISDDNFIV
jgi:hypothetical protein